eukprot:UN15133
MKMLQRAQLHNVPIEFFSSDAENTIEYDPDIIRSRAQNSNAELNEWLLDFHLQFAECADQRFSDLHYWDESAAVWMEQRIEGFSDSDLP